MSYVLSRRPQIQILDHAGRVPTSILTFDYLFFRYKAQPRT